jgi:hypothetical protein
LTLYLVLDEAHRGMQEGKRSNNDNKPTIVKQLINGSGSVPGIPIVWGISATVQRFNDAVSETARTGDPAQRGGGSEEGAGVGPSERHHQPRRAR